MDAAASNSFLSTPPSPAQTSQPSERVLTQVPWSVYTPRSTCSSVERPECLVDVDEEEEDVTLRDLHAEVRLFREEAAAATYTSRLLCDINYALLLEEVRSLRLTAEPQSREPHVSTTCPKCQGGIIENYEMTSKMADIKVE
ncbi:hypothetical protein PR048_014710 [Dryococelus australis]|uniref:Uncharacterized protein n=1 Tax=Dryococelus australis TaxID=614101 RepID=A0ABQ9HEY5_9NEOP|nr:hypothetical protein PR048_014710 [Dryococelus australis]